MRFILIVTLAQRVPHNVRDMLDQRPLILGLGILLGGLIQQIDIAIPANNTVKLGQESLHDMPLQRGVHLEETEVVGDVVVVGGVVASGHVGDADLGLGPLMLETSGHDGQEGEVGIVPRQLRRE